MFITLFWTRTVEHCKSEVKTLMCCNNCNFANFQMFNNKFSLLKMFSNTVYFALHTLTPLEYLLHVLIYNISCQLKTSSQCNTI